MLSNIAKFKSSFCFNLITRGHCRQISQFLHFSKEIRTALRVKKPIVALESTIITHGMPYPANLNTAINVERIIRDQGAIPATIGVINGQIKVGLTEKELILLATAASSIKVSRKDLPMVITKKLNGGTTVATTMAIAHAAGIFMFVTGGIGGVHRGGEITMDVSADLIELGRTPVAVICSGVKSILDIGRTLEVLETQGVSVATLGATADFPAFYSSTSGLKSPWHLTSLHEAVEFVNVFLKMQLKSGAVIAIPVPQEYSIPAEDIESAIKCAVDVCQTNGVHGPAVTPFILAKVADITAGRALAANTSLIENNAKIGAQIAVGLNSLQSTFIFAREKNNDDLEEETKILYDLNPKVTVVGGSVLDLVVRVTDSNFKVDGRTLNGQIQCSAGGVGRNIAEGLTRLGIDTQFISVVGQDPFGDLLQEKGFSQMQPKRNGLINADRSAACVVVCDNSGDSRFLVGDMNCHNYMDEVNLRQFEETLTACSLIVFDGNIPTGGISYLMALAQANNIPVFFEPTDHVKAQVPFQLKNPNISFMSPNKREFIEIFNQLTSGTEELKDMDDIIDAAYTVANNFVSNILITLGADGVLLVRKGPLGRPFFASDGRKLSLINVKESRVSHQVYTPPHFPPEKIVNVSGTGDCFASAFIYGALSCLPEDECIQMGFRASQAALSSWSAVPENLTQFVFNTR